MIIKTLVAALLSITSALTYANDADDNWKPGMPWPTHWAQKADSGDWNTIVAGYVHQILTPEAVASSWLKDIPYAMQPGASASVCLAQKGLFRVSGFCWDMLVDPEMRGKIQAEDMVLILHPKHGTVRAFNSGPGPYPETAFRIFQKVGVSTDDDAWRPILFARQVRPDLANKVDQAWMEHVLTRDFGPRAGGEPIELGKAYRVQEAAVQSADPEVAPMYGSPAAQ